MITNHLKKIMKREALCAVEVIHSFHLCVPAVLCYKECRFLVKNLDCHNLDSKSQVLSAV